MHHFTQSLNSRTVYFNGDFIEEEKVFLHVSDLAIQRGYGVFDFFKVIDGVPVFMNDHLDRFFNSAAGLRLDPGVNRAELTAIIQELMQRNKLPQSGIKIMLTGGYSPDSYNPGIPNLIIGQPLIDLRPAKMADKGLKVITYEHVRELPEIKSINYITGVLLQRKLAETGADDVLYHKNGEVSEFPRSNFFIVTKDDKVITPAKDVLRGITRMKALEIAKNNFITKEGTVTIDDIRNAKEAFITSTSKQITPVVQVDDIIINDGEPGAVTRLLNEEYSKLLK